MPAGSGGIICENDVNRLVALFLQFEGASDPLSIACKEAEQQFNALVEKLYTEQVVPNFQSITLIQFRSFARRHCRACLARSGRPHPCV
jgi:hypothetical protein